MSTGAAPPPPSRADFRIAILCPLPLEAKAVKPLFDPVYAADYHAQLGKVTGDPNSYTLGKIGPYNVVLVHMPSAGKAIAASCATHIKLSYPRIELSFLIGICGGVPRVLDEIASQGEINIHLGDVIISTGVVQYDLGKRLPRRFVRKDTLETNLGRPSQEVRSFVSKIRAWDDSLGSLQSKYLAIIQEKINVPYPGAKKDILFSPEYKHKDRGCQCAGDLLVDLTVVARQKDTTLPPAAHFGALASGDTVMMSGKDRDRIARKEQAIGFEMEGAGVWDNLPCILVKGVSDYADCHKSKDWQSFAAAKAAACVRALLDMAPISIPSPSMELNQGHSAPLRANLQKRLAETLEQPENDLEAKYTRFLESPQMDFRRNEILNPHQKTCEWLERRPEYESWLDANNREAQKSFFWIKGKPGTGKSTLMKYLLHTAKRNEHGDIILSFFFYAQGVELERSTVGMYQSILHQLISSKTVPYEAKRPYFEFAAKMQRIEGDIEWSIRDLKNILLSSIMSLKNFRVLLLIDALDECDQDEVGDMILFLQHLIASVNRSGVHLRACLASRHYPSLQIEQAVELVLQDQPEHQADIKEYVEANFKGGKSRKAQEIRDEICAKASGVFLWVQLVVRSLNEAWETGRLLEARRRLDEIPADLDKLFTRILTSDEKDLDSLVLCLQLVLFSPSVLSSEELYFALSFADAGLVERDTHLHTDELIVKYIVNVSKGLIEISSSGSKMEPRNVYFIHESVRDFLLRRNGFSKLRAELGCNIVGRSHEIIAQVCFEYMCVVSANSYFRQIFPLFGAGLVRRAIPFFPYVGANILYHSNAAQATGISQLAFLAKFSSHLDAYKLVHNATERYKSREYGEYESDVRLLYILADKGMNYLVSLEITTHGYDWEISGRCGSPILAAADSGDAATIKALIGCRPHSEQSVNKTFIDAEAITLMREHLVESRKRGQYPRYSDMVIRAVNLNYPIIINLLLQTSESNNPSAVDLALCSDQLQVAKAVLNLWHSNILGMGRSPYNLIKLREYYSASMIDCLLSYGCLDIDSLTENGRNALHLVLREDDSRLSMARLQERLTKRLIRAGCNPAHQDENGQDPFCYATYKAKKLVLAARLEDENLEVNQKNKHQKTSSSSTKDETPTNAASIELQRTGLFDVNYKDNKQITPLIWAVRRGNWRGIEYLLKFPELEIDYRLPNGQTALSVAAMLANDRIVSLLLATGRADINSQDSVGRTPLSWAAGPYFPLEESSQTVGYCSFERLPVIEKLTECALIDPAISDFLGHSPFWWAQTYNSLMRGHFTEIVWDYLNLDSVSIEKISRALACRVPQVGESTAVIDFSELATSYSRAGWIPFVDHRTTELEGTEN